MFVDRIDEPGRYLVTKGPVAGALRSWVGLPGNDEKLTQLSRSGAVARGVKSPRSGRSSAPPIRRLMEIL